MKKLDLSRYSGDLLLLFKMWPERVSVELTTRCNLNCIMCALANEGGDYILRNLEDTVFDNLRGSLPKINIISLNGHGESLIHPKFLQIMEEMGNTVQRLELTSNGLMITDELAKSIVQIGMAELTISIHAADPAIYSEITQKGDLQRLIKNISGINHYKKLYNRALPSLAFQFVGMQRNILELHNVLSLASELQAHKVVVLKLLEYEMVRGESLDRYPELIREHLPPAMKYAKDLGIELIVPSDYLKLLELKSGLDMSGGSFSERVTTTPENKHLPVRNCLDPWNTAFITVDGEVCPCCNIRESAGCLKESTFEAIWFGGKLSMLRNRILSGNPPQQCLSCSQRGMTTLSRLKFKVALRGIARMTIIKKLYSALISPYSHHRHKSRTPLA